jgi:prepilin-type N-terminal cleavage/methylation domain-containing protein
LDILFKIFKNINIFFSKKGLTRLVDFGDAPTIVGAHKNASPKLTTGFTLLEVLIVFGILGIVATASSGFYNNYNKSIEIKTTAKVISADLKQMQAKSMAGEGGLKWGIHFVNGDSHYYELFSTTDSYSVGKIKVSENYLPSRIAFSSPTLNTSKDIIFNKITGETVATSISITASDVTETISIATIGTITTDITYGNVAVAGSYDITATSGGGGTVTPTGKTSVVAGSNQAYSITPFSSYGILLLVVDGQSITPVTSYTFSSVARTHTISATFTPVYALTISTAGTGSGTVTGAATYNYNTAVTATATASTGSTFSGWSGDCNSGGQVTMTSAKTCTATFALNSYTVNATAGSGGTVTAPTSKSVNHGSTTTFTITANTGYTASASGCGGSLSGTTYTTGTITAACTVAATFTINTYRLTLTKAGAGSGTVTSNPAGVSCGATCNPLFNYNTSVVLSASASSGSTFSGWSGEGCSGTSTCTVSMTQARDITATFAVACSGTLSNGYCWYMAAQGQTCDSFCTTHGGCLNATLSFNKESQVCAAVLPGTPTGLSGNISPRTDNAWCYIQGNQNAPDDPMYEETCTQAGQWHWNACSCVQ